MQTLITYLQAQHIDKIAQEKYKVPSNVLMERAAYEFTTIFLKHFNNTIKLRENEVKNIIVLCGASNNGGDAQAVARMLSQKKIGNKNLLRVNLEVVFLAKPKSLLAKEQFRMLQSHNILYTVLNLDLTSPNNIKNTVIKNFRKKLKTLGPSDYIIDGISGVGQKGVFRYPDIIEAVNTSLAQVFSIDVPSGLYEDLQSKDKHTSSLKTIKKTPIINARMCICMGLAKKVMYNPEFRKYCGEIKIVNPGFPENILHHTVHSPSDKIHRPLQFISFSDMPTLWKKPSLDTYKHKRGVVAIAAGCKKSPGAAFLALQAATHSAAGLVHGILDDEIKSPAALACPSAITGTDVKDFFMGSKNSTLCHACVVGCGWGTRPDKMLETFFNLPAHCSLILDADALRMLPHIYTHRAVQKKAKILCPHVGELQHLCKPLHIQTNNILTMAETVAHHYNAVVIAKSSLTYIVMPKHTFNNSNNSMSNYVVDSRCPTLATGGSGDVLAGFLGGIVAYYNAINNKNIWDNLHNAAAVSVILHAEAGKNIQKKACTPNAQTIIKAISEVYSLV